MITYLKRLFWAAALLFGMLLLALYGLLATESGLHWALRLAQQFAPGELQVGAAQGTLVSEIQLQNLRYRQPNGLALQLAQARLRWQPWALLNKNIHINQLYLSHLELLMPSDGKLPEKDAPPFSLPEIQIALPLRVQLDDVQVQQAVIHSCCASFSIAAALLQAELTDNNLILQRLQVTSPLAAGSLQGDFALMPPNALNLRFDWLLPLDTETLPGATLASGTAYVSGQWRDLRVQHRLHAPALLQLDAKAQATTQDLHWQADLSWEALRWPLATEQAALAMSHGGKLHARGDLQQYQLQLETLLEGPNLPAAHWQAQGQGTQSGLKLHELHAEVLGGKLDASGWLNWSPQLAWDLHLRSQGLNPGKHWADLPGTLAATLHTQGALDAQGVPHIAVNLQQLKGQLRGYPVQAQAALQLDGARYRIKQLTFQSGSTQLTAQADLGAHADEKIQAKCLLKAPDLKTLLPHASGALQAEGDISGTVLRPHIQARLHGKQLAWADFRLGNLVAEAQLNLGGTNEKLHLNARAQQIQQAGKMLLENAHLQLDGRTQAHTLKMQLQSPQQALTLELAGDLNLHTQNWRGQWQSGQLALGRWGDWRLTQPVAVQISPQAFSVAENCWHTGTQPNAKICLQAQRQGGDTQMQTSVQALPASFFQPLLPPDVRLSGDLTADLNARLLANGELRGQSQIKLSAGDLRTILLDDWQVFPHQGGLLTLHLDDTGLTSQLELKLLENSGLRADLQLPGLHRAELPANQILQGGVQAEFKDFNLLPKLMPPIENAQGKLDLAMTLQGSLDAPQISGQMNILQVATEIPDLGLKIKDLNAQLRGDGSPLLQFQGQLRSGEGELHSQGTVTLRSFSDWLAEVTVQGKNLQIIDTTDFSGKVSPDLRVLANPQQVKISGQVHIPQADIKPNLIIGTTDTASGSLAVVPASADVVILTPEAKAQPATAPAPRLHTQVDVLLSLGNNIRLDVADFKSRLGGAVQVFLDPAQAVLRGNGAVFIKQGIFRAYGQDLAIDQGFIIFNDGPLDNPGLNIKAVRTIYKDTNKPKVNQAGVHITGTVQNPRLTLFSEPQVEDGKILSYIVTGTALGDSNNSGRSLSLGGYLRPNFYVSFGFSLFDSAKVFNLRYDINDKWGLETSIGDQDSGVDISYTLGR